MSANDKLKHEAEDLTGKAKEAVGDATGNEKLEDEGKADQVSAKVKKVGDDVKDLFRK